ncbi:MAG: hypothetical protein ACRDTG_16180 [Pseudonocardiaceae bacterium]
MAVPRGMRFAVEHDEVFPEGAAIVGPVSADMEYVSTEDKARGKQPKQRRDEASGLLQWKVTVSDPSAEKDRDKSVNLTMLAEAQPVPPATAIAGFDFRPVYFEGLTIEARVMGEKFKYQGWVYRATGMHALNAAAKPHGKAPMAVPGADKSAA